MSLFDLLCCPVCKANVDRLPDSTARACRLHQGGGPRNLA